MKSLLCIGIDDKTCLNAIYFFILSQIHCWLLCTSSVLLWFCTSILDRIVPLQIFSGNLGLGVDLVLAKK